MRFGEGPEKVMNEQFARRLARVETKLDAMLGIMLAGFVVTLGGLWASWSQLVTISYALGRLAGG
jgi:hypothetical protein